MLEEETDHLAARIGSERVGERTGGASSRPGVARAVDQPALGGDITTGSAVDETCELPSAGDLPATAGLRQATPGPDLVEHPLRIARVHRGVAIAVEHDRRERGPLDEVLRRWSLRSAPPHRGERGAKVVCRAGGHPRMDTDGGIQVRIRCGHDRRHRAAGGHAGNVDAALVHPVTGHHVLCDSGDDRRLTPAAPLVCRHEPVPAPRHVGGHVLSWVRHQERALLGELVEPGPGGGRVGILGAAMEHDDERHRLPRTPARDVELVRAGSCLVRVGALDEAPAGRRVDLPCAPRRGRGGAGPARRALDEPLERLGCPEGGPGLHRGRGSRPLHRVLNGLARALGGDGPCPRDGESASNRFGGLGRAARDGQAKRVVHVAAHLVVDGVISGARGGSGGVVA
jgi:hypothetical protein